ncbi:hypothetical protein JQ567_19965 [Bradyrhizobium sp. AUGA SZCCT0431]|nr:hypothetical protein [Bradyrhizobium sp. AUGA SZCCT0431]
MPIVMVSERKIPVQQDALQLFASLAFHRLLKITLQIFMSGRPHGQGFTAGIPRQSVILSVAHVPHFQCLREPPDRKHNLVQLEQVLRVSSIPIKQVAIVSISVLIQATNKIDYGFFAPHACRHILRPYELSDQQFRSKRPHRFVQPFYVMAESARRSSIHEKHSLEVLLEAMDGQPEEINIQLLLETPSGQGVIVIGRRDKSSLTTLCFSA